MPKLRIAACATTLLYALSAFHPGTAPSVCAAEPRPTSPGVGALTLAPSPFAISVDWLERAEAAQDRPRQEAERLADLIAEERAARLDARTANLAAAPATPTLTQDATPRVPSLPVVAEADVPNLAPEARPTEFFTGYGASPASAPAAGRSHAPADAYLVEPVGRRVSADLSAGAYTVSAASSMATVASGYAAPTRSLPAADFPAPTADWAKSSATRGLSVGATTLPTLPAMPYANAVLPARTGLGSGGFNDLSATAPAQARPAPLLIAPGTNALPAGQTLYVTEFNQGTVTSATGSGGTLATYKTFAAGDNVQGIATFGGSLYAVDQTAKVINRIVLSTGVVSQFASLSAYTTATALAIDASGNLYVSAYNASNANVIVKATTTGAVSTFVTLPTTTSGTNTIQANALGLAFDASGNLYTANANPKTISKITPAGSISTFATFNSTTTGAANAANIYLSGLAFDRSGNLFVADGQYQNTNPADTGTIYKVTASGVISNYVDLGANKGPVGIAFDSNGVLYAAIAGGVAQIPAQGTFSMFATDPNDASNYLVVASPVPEPSTYLGGALLLAAAGWGWRRRVRLA